MGFKDSVPFAIAQQLVLSDDSEKSRIKKGCKCPYHLQPFFKHWY